MKIFKELNKLGYKHYTEYTIEELDNLPLNSEKRTIEQSLVLRWFREKHQLDYWVRAWWVYDRTMFIGYEALVGKGEHCGTYEFYEYAELACLKKLIEIAKKK